ncbi:MAG: hypothetical protein ABJQ70_02735 [Roseobacter sp.]
MTRRFIATVVAAALSVTAIGTAPAQANEDVARTLAAIAGIAIVTKIISDKTDKKKKSSHKVSNKKRYAPPVQKVQRVKPRPLPQKARRHLLPGDCLRSYETRNGHHRIFGKSCLKKNYNFTHSLPHACEVSFRASKKKRSGYDAQCLRRAGYHLART